MENERLSKVWLGHIPDEILPNILSRLPARSLGRFRCVSTSWLSLINDADFRRLHLNNARNGKHLLVIQGPKKSCVLRSSITFEQITDEFRTLRPWGDMDSDDSDYDHDEYDDGWSAECCIDGLILIKSQAYDTLELLNPVSNKLLEFAPLPEIKINPRAIESTENVEIGLGYDASLKDYKHIRLIFYSDDESLHTVAIYTVGSASWKIIQSKDKGFPDWDLVLKLWTDRPVYLQGSLYFIGIDELERDILISIDVSSEKFCHTSFPGGVYSNGPLRLVDEECTLAFFESEYKSMWVWGSSGAESESMCWTKRYSFILSVPHCLHINKNSDMLIQWLGEKVTFKLGTEKEIKQKREMVSSYNLETEDEKILQLTLDEDGCEPENFIHVVFGFDESLILL